MPFNSCLFLLPSGFQLSSLFIISISDVLVCPPGSFQSWFGRSVCRPYSTTPLETMASLFPVAYPLRAFPLWWPLIMSQFIVNPKPFLSDLTGKAVRVRLKWGQEYQGILSSSDAYMNLRLDKTEEFVDGEFAGFLGEVLIRCNNVLYIKAAPSGGAQKMEE